MDFMNRLLWMPLTAFVYTLDIMSRTMQGMQQTAQQIRDSSYGSPSSGGPDRSNNLRGTVQGGATNTSKEAGEMSQDCGRDQCGNDSCEIKLYEYYILSVKPDHERVVVGPRHVVITSEMSNESFAAYVIATFYQEQGHEELKHDEKKYLRVCSRIACTLPKERPKYQRDQVSILADIRDILGGKPYTVAAT
ncbi:MAG: hypothetical protein ABUT39_08460 [Acidobacteriota bacterium]